MLGFSNYVTRACGAGSLRWRVEGLGDCQDGLDVRDRAGAAPHDRRLSIVLGVKLSQNLRTLIPSDVRLLLGAFSELLGMTVDRLARAGTDIVGDLAPVLAVDLDSLEEALVLFVTPVALTLATLMLDNAFRSLDYLIRSFRDSLFDLCLSLALSFQIALAHLGQKLFLFEGADNLCRVIVLSVDLS